ncbi:MAG: hypothetical protein JWO92_1422 [Chitinophagaceae bacterium]|nr:hypothetical protein [Chitinophagaceae bacterium]MDB5223131.1 hypothetical protein [Chitinophagaceae bacterium]
MKNYTRPLTKTMVTKLLYCRQIELEGQYCLPEDIKYALAPLYKRGYIGLKKAVVNGKEMMAVFTTPEGIHCLENIRNSQNISQN